MVGIEICGDGIFGFWYIVFILFNKVFEIKGSCCFLIMFIVLISCLGLIGLMRKLIG